MYGTITKSKCIQPLTHASELSTPWPNTSWVVRHSMSGQTMAEHIMNGQTIVRHIMALHSTSRQVMARHSMSGQTMVRHNIDGWTMVGYPIVRGTMFVQIIAIHSSISLPLGDNLTWPILVRAYSILWGQSPISFISHSILHFASEPIEWWFWCRHNFLT